MSSSAAIPRSSIGPVEYVLIEFAGNRFEDAIVPALADLVERGVVRILDLVFVIKDAAGDVRSLEYDERNDLAPLVELDGTADGVLSEEDLELVAEALDPDTSVLLVVWEDVWATPLAEAVRAAGGQLRGGERIPHEIVVAAFDGTEG